MKIATQNNLSKKLIPSCYKPQHLPYAIQVENMYTPSIEQIVSYKEGRPSLKLKVPPINWMLKAHTSTFGTSPSL